MSFAVGQRSCQVWPHGSSRGRARIPGAAAAAYLLPFFLQLLDQITFLSLPFLMAAALGTSQMLNCLPDKLQQT